MIFRINLNLKIKNFFKSFFISEKEIQKSKKIICKESNKKHFTFASQGRVAFYILLKFLKSNNNKKKIIFSSYNLAEMINVARYLNLEPIFCDLDNINGSYNLNKLSKMINKDVLAIVLTNLFNDQNINNSLKKICNKEKITLIEDNAVYYGNYSLNKKNEKIYSGSFGEYTIFSFNIVKNISSFYLGGIAFNNFEFLKFYLNEEKNQKKFPLLYITKKIMIFFFIHSLKIRYVYILFFKLFKFSYQKNIKTILSLTYPTIKFKIKKKTPELYLKKPSKMFIKTAAYQILDFSSRKKQKECSKKNNIYFYNEISNLNSNYFSNLNIKNFDFQNFNEYPILLKNTSKTKFHNYMLENNVELKKFGYVNCKKLFYKNENCFTSELYEENLIFLPNHNLIDNKYKKKIIKLIKNFKNN